MNERPILFSGEMVRAILDGRKTQTRRVIKPAKTSRFAKYHDPDLDGWPIYQDTGKRLKCPYGIPGDRLWVRETFKYLDQKRKIVCYRASPDTCDDGAFIRLSNWKPSIHMPRWASRIMLKVTDVRVERLWEMTTAKMEAEGVQAMDDDGRHPLTPFIDLWNSINGKRDYGWNVDPWVWVVEFRMLES